MSAPYHDRDSWYVGQYDFGQEEALTGRTIMAVPREKKVQRFEHL